jgi:putative phage-type endonuclease
VNAVAEKFPNRNEYLGCSEVAAAVGLNPWQTPLDLFLEKTGQVPRPDLSQKDSVRFGELLEDVVADEFARRSGLEVRRDSREFAHPELPFLRGHIDRRIVGRRAGLECKTAGIRMAADFGEAGTDEVPPHYLVQCAAYMAVTGFDEWHLAVLIAGNDFRTYRIPRDEELIAGIEARARAFWDAVRTGQPPAAVTAADVRALYKQDDGTEVIATPEVAEACANLAAAKAQLKAAEALEEQLATQVQSFMGPHARLLGADGKPLATWTTVRSSRLDGKRLEADHPELAAQYRADSVSRRFTLKLK